MTELPILNGNDRDAGVVEEICGYLTQAPPAAISFLPVLVLVKRGLWLKFFAGLPASSSTRRVSNLHGACECMGVLSGW